MTNQSKAGSWFSAKKIISAVIALILIVSMVATPALADSINSYKVNIVVDTKSITVTTNETEPIEILKDAGITTSKNDKIDVSSFKKGVGGKIFVKKLKTINIERKNKIKAYKVYSTTLDSALKEAKVTVGEKEIINYDLTTKVTDGMVVTIKKAKMVKVSVDGKTKTYKVIGGTVKDVLKIANIKLNDDDYTKPSLNTTVKNNTKIVVYRVKYITKTQTEAIDYSTEKKKDSKLDYGKTKIVQKGLKGSKKVTYKVKYINGKVDKKRVTNTQTLKQPRKKIVKIGTKTNGVKPNGVISKNGYTLGQQISGKYTHYCVCSTCNGNSAGITASGKRIWNGMKNPYYIACNWLPLGSVIKTRGHYYTVTDRGGSGLSVQGRIDIFTPAGHSAALRGGTGRCTITIVRLGW